MAISKACKVYTAWSPGASIQPIILWE